MKVALIGASGNAGQRLHAELVSRNHAVTAIARNQEKVQPLDRTRAMAGDIDAPEALAEILSGHDAVISSVMFVAFDPEKLLHAVQSSDVPRYLVVGGAGSLEVAPGVKLIDSPDFPDAYRAEAEAGGAYLDRLKRTDGLDWTFLSPSAVFEAGERTGTFRLGTDQLIAGPEGSRISYEDFVVAMVDELEEPKHSRARFTVGY
ncbi:NAD(P)-dependent oxidoreductase [Pseudooceanicola spongiae]|uniref:NAD(P)H-binding protein n=1 Tax=Pseudooceanicola spongiae TaxID=2613965 RepID=A0A7L9WIM9_9RHOB|nr:NAD(P)-dependent oxidoreductase [Pseudooceanicola spongiae]QOL79674.1 NAD(P)H-binding protein [Pseudooceanicola spongiae]